MADIKGPVVANKLYCDGVEVAQDVTFTLPEVVFKTAEISAMGTMTVPLIGLIDNLEVTINKIGLDEGFSKLSRLDKHKLEFRWVQTKINKIGSVYNEGCKAFVQTLPANIPSVNIEPGNATEVEHKFNVTRLELYVDGKESIVVDRLNNILKVNGVNYSTSISNLL